jgi:hypothetical protein
MDARTALLRIAHRGMTQPTDTTKTPAAWGSCFDCHILMDEGNARLRVIAGQEIPPRRCRSCESYHDAFGPENMFDSYGPKAGPTSDY